MTWRTHIDHRWDRDQLHIHVIDSIPGGYLLVGPGGESLTRIGAEHGASADTPTPSLILPEAAAPALLSALSRHLGAVEHPEQLRQDYEAERKRVDRFIAHLTPPAASRD